MHKFGWSSYFTNGDLLDRRLGCKAAATGLGFEE
jgi:hypothetical protein